MFSFLGIIFFIVFSLFTNYSYNNAVLYAIIDAHQRKLSKFATDILPGSLLGCEKNFS